MTSGSGFSFYNRFEPWFLLLILTIIWGSSFILIKNGLIAFEPGQAAALRLCFASVALLPFLPNALKTISRKDFMFAALTGVIGNLTTAFLFSLAQTQIPSSVSGMLNGLTPVFTVIIASAFFGFAVKWNHIIGLVMGLAGATVLSFLNSAGGTLQLNSYALLIVAATICYGVSLNIIKSKLGGVKPTTIAAVAIITIAPVCAVYLFLMTDVIGRFSSDNEGMYSLVSLAILGTFSTAVGIVLYARLIKLTTPLFASSVAYLMPIVAVMWGLLDGEQLHWLHFVSMALILAGVLNANKSQT